VTPDVEKLPDGDVTVTFRIAEGRKITIDRVVIEGAHGVSAKDIRAVMATQEREYYILPGTVQRQKLDEDVERIVQLYNDHGYIQARVESTDVQIDRTRAKAVIRVTVVEGPQFRVGGVDVTGTAVLPVEEIKRRIKLAPGDVFSRSKLRDSTKAITDLYSAIGRASADATPEIAQDIPNRKINITFDIIEGPEVSVERINISGNTRSQEKILRREIPMAEGDLFTSQKLARARQRLVNLNYFETVNATTTPGATKDKIIVNIDVVEKPTGLFSIGGGYSSQDSFIGTVDLSQRNFLGRGWEVFIRLRGGAQTQQGQIGFTEPWLFDRPLSAGFDLFNNRRVFTDYTVNSLGGDVRLGHPLGEFSRVNALYRASQDEISDVAPNASVNLLDQEGIHYTSMIGLALARDTRDSVFEPTRGGNTTVAFDFAGIGFGQQWFRITTSASQFFSLPTPWFDGVLGVRASAGYSLGWGNDPVPLFERFYLGGANSIRSFKAQEVSPRDSSGTRIGGNIQALGNIEYTVPLFFGIRVAAFYDVGNVWGPDISAATDFFDSLEVKQAIGLGVRWVSPFGPIRVDYGVNPNPKKGEQFGNFNFSVGSAF
jgi:outer membrane protein insertion porin family